MNFRSKSADRAIDQLLALVDKWQIEMVEVVDNILDMGHLKEMLPQLAENDRHIRLFYEVKANLNRSAVGNPQGCLWRFQNPSRGSKV